MYQFSVAEIARARWEERVCGIPTPAFARRAAKTGAPSPSRYAAGSGRGALHPRLRMLHGREAELRVETVRVAGPERHPPHRLEIVHHAAHEELAPPAAMRGHHHHVTDPAEPAAVGDDAREADLLPGRVVEHRVRTRRCDRVLDDLARPAVPPVRLLHEERVDHVDVDHGRVGRDGVVALSPPVDRVGAQESHRSPMLARTAGLRRRNT